MPTQRVAEFDIWRPGYAGAVVTVYVAGTTTLASVYTDEALTVAAANPQTLASLTQNDVTYGKFSAPLYTAQAYQISIAGSNEGGIVRPPLTTLAGQNASTATARATDGSVDQTLASVLARSVYATDYGTLSEAGGSTATNTATLTAAIGEAASRGGGAVIVPAGTYAFSQITLSARVVLVGQGRGVTVLQSQTQDNVVTLSGDQAGLACITLDGIDLQAGSVGVYSKANDEILFHDVEVKRFATGLHCKGGRRGRWRDFSLTNCATGAKLHGDNDAGNGADGDEFRHLSWIGGRVRQCSTAGVHFSYEDKLVQNNALEAVGFEDNTGTALNINGARYTSLDSCWFSGNTTTIAIADDGDTTDAARLLNTTIGFLATGGSIDGGAITITGTAQDVVFEQIAFADATITPTLPGNAILLDSCTEASDVIISGDGTKVTRFQRIRDGASAGVTTSAAATKAWSIALEPGQLCYLEAHVIGNQKNGTNTGEYHIAVSAKRPGSTLAYETQTANFTVGDTLTGATSGATATIIADSDSGTTGTLTLRDIVGTFQDGEIITDGAGGSAVCNGTLVAQNAALLGSVTAIRAAREDVAGWDAAFVANIGEIELRVTGASSTTIEWLCNVKATVS